MSDRLPAGFVTNREIGASVSSPITADKLEHLFHDIVRFAVSGNEIKRQIGTRAKVGATAGWTVGAADNLPYVGTLPASQTGSTLIIPLDGLVLGDVITGFKIVAQIESAGGAVTLDADLRATTNVAAEPTDASIGTMTQVSVTADTAVSQEKTGLSEVVTSGKTYYLKLTGTTAAATDIILQACEIYVQENISPITITEVLFVADKAGTLEEVAAGLDESGTNTSITIDIVKRPATSMLSATISLVHGTGDRTEVSGTISGSGSYATGDVVAAVITVTSATGARGLWVRVQRSQNGD